MSADAAAPASTEWLAQRERGALWLMRATIRLATLVGRRPMKLAVALIALWYALFDRAAVRASRDWLRRVRGREPRRREVLAHLRTFVQVTLDRVFLLTGRTRGLEFERHGNELLSAQLATGRGAILLGSHLGSFEALRAAAQDEHLPVNALGNFTNARMVNALLEGLDPGRAARVIHLGEDPVGAMAQVRARLEAGEFVALLGDRAGADGRVVRVPFLGEEAAFTPGPYLLAHVLRCPIYLVFGVYSPPGRYALFCEPLAERVELPRAGRDAALAALATRYAERLEHHARRAPYNWFNFYDVWSRA